MKKNEALEDTVKEKDQQIEQLKARIEELEAGAAGAKANRPILKSRPQKSVIDFDMDEDTGHAQD